MKCRYCLEEKNGLCLCGFCKDCDEKHGHINLQMMIDFEVKEGTRERLSSPPTSTIKDREKMNDK